VLLAALLVGAAGCDTVEPAKAPRLVVEGFLDAGEPLPTVTLRHSRALQRPYPRNDSAVAATGATMTLTVDGERVPYESVPGRPSRYAPSAHNREQQRVPPRSSFRLRAEWRGRTARADGRIPPTVAIDSSRVRVPPEPVEAVLLDSLRLDTLNTDARQGYIYPVEVTLWWKAASGTDSTLWVRPHLRPSASFSEDAVDFFLRSEDIRRERTVTLTANGYRRWTGVYAVPVEDRTASFPAHRLRVAVLRSYGSYARLAATRESPRTREPVSNVEGALGVAAGISVDSAYVSVR
jgi:hypothetical protein